MNNNQKSLISLKNKKQFDEVYSSKVSFANKYLVMYIKKNNFDYNQIGISVSKKVGNSVIRHRVKRLILESYRLNHSRLMTGFDFVIVARNTSVGLSFKDIESAFLHLCKLHKINIDFKNIML